MFYDFFRSKFAEKMVTEKPGTGSLFNLMQSVRFALVGIKEQNQNNRSMQIRNQESLIKKDPRGSRPGTAEKDPDLVLPKRIQTRYRVLLKGSRPGTAEKDPDLLLPKRIQTWYGTADKDPDLVPYCQ